MTSTDNFITGVEDIPIETPIQASAFGPICCSCYSRLCCCSCSYTVPTLKDLWTRDKRLLRSILVIVILLNIPIGQYILYPFMIFSTWIHESFHGIAAISVGGGIEWLNIYSDGSGLASTYTNGSSFQRGWVASAGYQSTAVVGGIMLMFRRSNIACRVGTCGIGFGILLSVILFIRNSFGLIMMAFMGSILVLAGWCLPQFWVGELYALLASTTCLNAITSVRVLYSTNGMVNGVVTAGSDSVTMEEVSKVIPSWAWATIWMLVAFYMTTIGICFTIETKENNTHAQEQFRAEEMAELT